MSTMNLNFFFLAFFLEVLFEERIYNKQKKGKTVELCEVLETMKAIQATYLDRSRIKVYLHWVFYMYGIKSVHRQKIRLLILYAHYIIEF
jgi:hypothetical protein